MVKALPFIYQPDWVTRKASDVSAADWRYQTHIKKIYFFFYTSSYGFSQGWKSLNSTIVNVINYKLNLLAQAILRNIDPRTVLTQAQINNNYSQVGSHCWVKALQTWHRHWLSEMCLVSVNEKTLSKTVTVTL